VAAFGQEHIAWVALSLVRHLGGKTLDALLARFGSAEVILAATAAELQQVSGVGAKTAAAIRQIDPDAIARHLDRWQQQGVQVITPDHAQYPALLRELADYPPTLFVHGAFHPAAWGETVAIVGTRQPQPTTRGIALSLAARLAGAGCTIVSGLASGIDAAAHRGALSIRNGQTLAVLGGGVLNPYPPQHHDLAARLRERGCLISEQAPEASVNAPRLVARNRIISGLCRHVIVIESADNGGAMHAARFAYTQKRHLYALDISASGNQALLAHGAHPIAPDLNGFRLLEPSPETSPRFNTLNQRDTEDTETNPL
jgi:DNA processing protein